MKKIVGFLVLFITLTPGFSQAPFFQQYFLLRKNDPVQVNTIFQDRKGFMWVGTSKGLFKFDGKTQQRYTTAQGLPHEIVTAVAEDSLGRIWIGHQNGKIAILEKNKLSDFDPPEGSAAQAVSDILFDKKGNLWFATLNDGLYFFKNNRLHRVDAAEGLPDLYIYDLLEDNKGNIWAGTDGGAAVCTLHGSKISIDVIDYKDGLPDNIIRKMILENENTMLLATEDAGVIRYDLKSKKFESLRKESWKYGPVSDFVIKGNKAWITCSEKGLLVFDLVTSRENLHTAEKVQGLTSVRVLAKDSEGNIWVGSKTSLLRTPGDHLEFIEKPDPLSDANILAITVDQEDNIWFSNSKGLYKRKSNSEDVIIKPLENSRFNKFTIISLYTDSKGYVWAGLYGEGVLRINPANGKIKHLNRELRNGNILNIAGRENEVWLATLGGTTQIMLLDNEELAIKNFSSNDGLVSDFIYQVFVQGNKVWFATDGKGIAMLDSEGFHHYDEGLPNAVIYGMVEDANHKLWVNVQGNGLYIFDGKKFQATDSAFALRDNEIHGLASDKVGNIVVMHDAGMDVIDVRKNKVVYLGEESGLRDKIANLNAIGKNALGHVFFGTNGGIVKYEGESDYLNNVPTPQIDKISVFDTPVDIVTSPELKYDENNITIHYMGIWYKNPMGLFYSYTLENYDLDWIASTNQFVTYSRLPPGKYTFRVKVSETSNFNGAPEVSATFTILPPIWQTIPFYLFSFITAAVLVYMLIKFRERKLRRDNELLETAVNVRTLEIQRQTEEIQAQNEEISAQSEEILGINENLENLVKDRTSELERKNKALEEYAFINAHKLRGPVATILGLVNLLPKTKNEGERNEINNRLQNTANELDGIVSSITKAIERGFRKIPRRPDEQNS